MFDVRACRGCLNTECKLEKISDAVRRIFPSLSGLQISATDGYPQYLCVECHAQVKKVISFRRKCRRAGFVLKQIMTAKKQVCYNDIKAVNRKKTNLESQMTFCSLLVHVDIIPEEVLEEQRRLEEERLEEQRRFEEEDKVQAIINDFEDDGVDGDDIQTDTPQNIDLDDVFKDLNEEEEEEESEEEVEEIDVKQPVVPVKEKKAINIRNPYLNRDHLALTRSEVKYLSEEKQIAIFRSRLESEPFKTAAYKCSICVTTYPSIEKLIVHLEVHNKPMVNSHTCSVCKWRFEAKEQLTVHLAENHWYLYLCGWCKDTHITLAEQKQCFRHPKSKKRLKSKYLDHYMKFFDKRPLAQQEMDSSLASGSTGHNCTICGMPFGPNRSLFVSHMNHHSRTEDKNICDICGAYFSVKRMRSHMELYHLYSLSCKECSEVVTNGALAKYHILNECRKTKEKELSSTCPVCSRQYRTSAKLMEHLTHSHTEVLSTHHCSLCGHSYKSQSYLFRHQLNEHKYIVVSDPELCSSEWQCSECSVWFVNKRALETHIIKRGHGSADHIEFVVSDPELCSSEWQCSECSVWFVNKRALETHIIKRGHGSADHIERACVPCKQLFDTEEEYMTHSNTCTNTIYPRKCPYCDSMLQTLAGFMAHVKGKHKDCPLPHNAVPTDFAICELCGKEVRPKGKLKRHMLTHTAEGQSMALKCSLCVKTTTCNNLAALVNHVVITHTGKPFCCALCSNRFRFRYECRDHILKVHAPLRPYTCGKCARTFAHLDYLASHSLQAHDYNLRSADPRLFISKNRSKLRNKLALFPHMKVDVSLVDEKLLQEIDIYMCDYLEEKMEVLIDYSDYLIREPSAGYVPRRKRRKKEIEDSKLEEISELKIVSKLEEDSLIQNIEESNDGPQEEAEVDDTEDQTVLDELGREHKVVYENGVPHVMIDGVLYKLDME